MWRPESRQEWCLEEPVGRPDVGYDGRVRFDRREQLIEPPRCPGAGHPVMSRESGGDRQVLVDLELTHDLGGVYVVRVRHCKRKAQVDERLLDGADRDRIVAPVDLQIAVRVETVRGHPGTVETQPEVLDPEEPRCRHLDHGPGPFRLCGWHLRCSVTGDLRVAADRDVPALRRNRDRCRRTGATPGASSRRNPFSPHFWNMAVLTQPQR